LASTRPRRLFLRRAREGEQGKNLLLEYERVEGGGISFSSRLTPVKRCVGRMQKSVHTEHRYVVFKRAL
jgi:hypothetical protein